MHEGRTKKTGKLLTALSLCAEARGLFLQLSRDPATQARTRGGSPNKPLLPERKGCARVAQKARGTSDRPLAPCGGLGALPTPRTKTNNPSSHSEARKNVIKRAPSPLRSRGSKARPLEVSTVAPGQQSQGQPWGEPTNGRGPSERSLDRSGHPNLCPRPAGKSPNGIPP